MSTCLSLKDIKVTFPGKDRQEHTAVNGLSIDLETGHVLGFLGPNGAGKTTTIKTILGITRPQSGEVSLFGKPFSYRALSRIGYMPEIAYNYWYLTPFEILDFYGRIFRIPSRARKERIMELLKLVDLTGNEHTMVKAFSKGMLQKVSFAQALINDPDLLILDEPTTGLDPIAKMNMRDILIDLKKKGKTIFFSSHELSEVEVISDKVVIMKNGKILKEAAPKKILDEKGQHLSLEQYFFNLVRNS